MIKKYRIIKNYTQAELAEILNISLRHFQRIEANFKRTTIDMLIEIIKVLEIKDEDIIKMIKTF